MLATIEKTGQVDIQRDFLAALERDGFLDAPATHRAYAAMAQSGQDIDIVLTELGLLDENKLADALALFLGLGRAAAADYPSYLPTGAQVEHPFLRRSGILPLALTETEILIATARPLNLDSARALGYFLGRRAELKVAAASELAHHMARLLDGRPGEIDSVPDGSVAIEDDIERLRDIAREAPVIKLVSP